MCLDRNPEGDLQPLGCGCVGERAYGHLECSLAAAERIASKVGYCFWFKCSDCMQEFSGVTRMTLAQRWCELVKDRAEEDDERLEAAHNLASCFLEGGQHAEAEKMQREILAVRKRVLGDEYTKTLRAHKTLASCLSWQAKHAEAAGTYKEMLAVCKLVHGP